MQKCSFLFFYLETIFATYKLGFFYIFITLSAIYTVVGRPIEQPFGFLLYRDSYQPFYFIIGYDIRSTGKAFIHTSWLSFLKCSYVRKFRTHEQCLRTRVRTRRMGLPKACMIIRGRWKACSLYRSSVRNFRTLERREVYGEPKGQYRSKQPSIFGRS